MMKKGFGKGFCSGILVAALTVGLGVRQVRQHHGVISTISPNRKQ